MAICGDCICCGELVYKGNCIHCFLCDNVSCLTCIYSFPDYYDINEEDYIDLFEKVNKKPPKSYPLPKDFEQVNICDQCTYLIENK